VRTRIWLAAVLAPLLTGVLLIGTNVGGWRNRLLRQGPKPEIRALAVLPLANLSGDPQQEYFADSMTDALISQVGQVGSLRVISRTSVMQYKGTQKPLPQIARELNVDALVDGSVLRSGDRVRVTAQLIGAVPERHLWVRSYDRDLRDVLTLESEVARAIAEEVKAKVTPDVQARLSRSKPVDPEAHELFLKGVYSFHGATPDIKKALEYFQQAIQKDPNFAQPYLVSSWAYIMLGESNQMASNQAFPKAKNYAQGVGTR
jgi:TolB-like protein